MSTDETRIFTFSSNKNVSAGFERMDCRMDVWDTSSLASLSLYTKGEKQVQDRRCRFPDFKDGAPSDGSTYIILLLTEYYLTDKSGFLRIKLGANYEQVVANEEELVFTGYELRFTSAYYPTTELAYAMAVDSVDNTNYLMQYNWNDANKAPQLYPLRGLSDDPTAAVYAGNPHLDSIIYATNSDANDFPVKGYIVGTTNSVWTWNDCIAPDFNKPTAGYEQIVASPGSQAKLGFISRIELDVSSCNKEHVDEINTIVGADGVGISDDHEGMTLSTLDETHVTSTGFTFTSLAAASATGISPGDWEASLPLG